MDLLSRRALLFIKLFQASFEYRNKEFVSQEQAYQWAKAIAARDSGAAPSILESEDPYVNKKKLCGEGDESEDWKRTDIATLRAITNSKFKQNKFWGNDSQPHLTPNSMSELDKSS